ncbi:hypothetical protein RSAG8_03558, partial [Rhizoctonia solani AG-8 WAC10335]
MQCLKKLFSNLRFKDRFALGPELIYESDNETRVYGELFNGDEWHRIQVAHNRTPDPLEFWDRGKKFGLNGVHKPFWRSLPNFDICHILGPDLLHGFHKCYYDHIHKWNLTGLGTDEYDTRLKAQIPMLGEKMFPKGIAKANQVAGKEHRVLARVGVGLVACSPNMNAGGVGSNELTKAT